MTNDQNKLITKPEPKNHVGALNVECPKCGVNPGIFCVENPRRDLMLVHDERVDSANSNSEESE